MKKIILVLLFSLLFVTAYSQVMQVTIQILTVYHADGNDSPILRVSVDNRGYNFSGRNYGGFQTGGGISDVSNDPNNYDTYVITRSEFTAIRIDFEGWNDRCHNASSTYWDYNDNCKCPIGPFNSIVDCNNKNDYNRYYGVKNVLFWEYPNDGASSPMYYTGNNRQGITFRVSWTPIQPANIMTNLPSPEACGNADVLLTATLPGWFTSGLPATVSPYLRYVWQEGIPSGGNYTYTTLATTTSNTYTYKAPATAPLSGSLNRQFRVYTTLNNVYSLAGTQLNNPINIFPPPPTGITSIINPASCNGISDGNVLITGVTGGVGVYSYSISDGVQVYNSSKNTFNVNLPMDASNKPANVQGLQAGNYSVIVYNYYNATARCSYNTQITITEPAPLTVSSVQKSDYNGYNVSCKGSTNGTATVTGTGGNTPFTYLWDDEITFTNSSTNTNGSFINLKAGNYYTKIVDAKNCPVNPVITTFTEPAILTATPVKTDVLCNGAANGQININATGGAGGNTFSINNNPFVSTLPFTGLAPGNYTVVTKDQNNCTVTSIPTSIAEPAALMLSVSGKQDILCNGASTGSVLLSASGGVTSYQYSYDGINYQPSGTFNTIPAGIYNLKVKD